MGKQKTKSLALATVFAVLASCSAEMANEGQSNSIAAGLGADESDGEMDNDADGIPDAHDQCVGEREDMDGYQDNDGCPDVLLTFVQTDGNIPGPWVFDSQPLPDFRTHNFNPQANQPVYLAYGPAGAIVAIDTPVPAPANVVALGALTIGSGVAAFSATREAFENGGFRDLLEAQENLKREAAIGILRVLAGLAARFGTPNNCTPCETLYGPVRPSYVDTGHCHYPYGDPHEHYFEYHQDPQSCACQQVRRTRGVGANDTSMCWGRSWPNKTPPGQNGGSQNGGGGYGDGWNSDPWNNNNNNGNNSGGGYDYGSGSSGGYDQKNFRFDCAGSSCIGYSSCDVRYSGMYYGTEGECGTYINYYCGSGATGSCSSVY